MAESKARIAIVGVGLIGSSIGLALKAAKVNYEIAGYDARHDEAGQARSRGAIDVAETNLGATIESASLIICATPVGALPSIFREMAPRLARGAVITDTASTKTQVMAWADDLLPNHVSFVGGHPMAGRESSGAGAGDAGLFSNATWCISPLPSASVAATELISGLASTCGATPFFIDAHEHDGLVAAISHLPFVISTALARAVINSPEWPTLRDAVSPAFRDTTRLAGGDPTMYRDICRTNRDSIIRWMEIFSDELHKLRMAIAAEDVDLKSGFANAQEARYRWRKAYENQDERLHDLSELAPGKQLGQMLFGSSLFGRMSGALDKDKEKDKSKSGDRDDAKAPEKRRGWF